MRNLFISALILCPFLTITASAAAPFDYRAAVIGVLDNREYGGPPPLVDETFFFVRPEVELGLTIDGGHKIRGGFMYTQEFGASEKPDIDNLDLLAYYHYDDDDRLQFRFGAFPRAAALDLPIWFMSNDVTYYRPFAHGAAVRIKVRDIGLSAWVDWIGRQSRTVFEAFLFGYGANYNRGIFFARHDFIMYHRANTRPAVVGLHVYDNGGISAEAGVGWGKSYYVDSLSVRAGGMMSMDRYRGDDIWYTPRGGFASVYAGRDMFGLRGFVYAGQPQLFYWNYDFFYLRNWIESFYPLDYGFMSYGRVDVIANFVKSERVKADLFGSLHLFRGQIGFSQHFELSAEFGNRPRPILPLTR